MPNNLVGHTIVVTGTTKTHSIEAQIEACGGQVIYLPLIVTQPRLSAQDEHYMRSLNSYDWLIFTSQNAVDAFAMQLRTYAVNVANIVCHIAAVGIKTERALQALGFTVDFVPTTFSADVFIEEFPHVVTGKPRCLFLKGNLAKNTIQQLPFTVQPWIIYDTVEHEQNAQQLLQIVTQTAHVTVVFASPSAVQLYKQSVLPSVRWERVRVASIGHITTAALEQAGAQQILQPSTYTMQALTELIIQQSEGIS